MCAIMAVMIQPLRRSATAVKLFHQSGPFSLKLLLQGVIYGNVVTLECVHDLNLCVVSVRIEVIDHKVINVNSCSWGNCQEHI